MVLRNQDLGATCALDTEVLLHSRSCQLYSAAMNIGVLVSFHFIYLFIFWLRWVFVAAHRLSLVAASGGYSSLRCAGFSSCGAQAH